MRTGTTTTGPSPGHEPASTPAPASEHAPVRAPRHTRGEAHPPRAAHLPAGPAHAVARPARHTGSNIGLSLLGAGLLALAAVEAGLLVQRDAAPAHDGATALEGTVGERFETTPAAAAHGARATIGPTAAATPVQPAALTAAQPRPHTQHPTTVIGIAADSNTTGTTVFRLLSDGRIEASVLGTSNVWTEWVRVAPGASGNAPNPKSSDSD